VLAEVPQVPCSCRRGQAGRARIGPPASCLLGWQGDDPWDLVLDQEPRLAAAAVARRPGGGCRAAPSRLDPYPAGAWPILLGLLSIFLVANVFAFQPWAGTTTRSWWYFLPRRRSRRHAAAHVGVAHEVGRPAWAGHRRGRGLHPVEGVLEDIGTLLGPEPLRMLDAEQVALAAQVRQKTDPDDVFVTGCRTTTPVAMLTGRRIVVGFRDCCGPRGSRTRPAGRRSARSTASDPESRGGAGSLRRRLRGHRARRTGLLGPTRRLSGARYPLRLRDARPTGSTRSAARAASGGPLEAPSGAGGWWRAASGGRLVAVRLVAGGWWRVARGAVPCGRAGGGRLEAQSGAARLVRALAARRALALRLDGHGDLGRHARVDLDRDLVGPERLERLVKGRSCVRSTVIPRRPSASAMSLAVIEP